MATEEQTQWNIGPYINGDGPQRAGQRLTIANRKVTKLGFWIAQYLAPAGPYYYAIRRVSDDGILVREVAGQVEELGGTNTYTEYIFVSPPTVNEEAYILVEYDGGDGTHGLYYGAQNTDVKGGEYRVTKSGANYTNITTSDMAYIYTYEEPTVPAGGGGPANLVAAGII